nr:hypothetical protein [uncultured Bacillus sp.]
MDYYEIVTCPWHGVVKEVSITKGTAIEKENALFLIQLQNGEIRPIIPGLRGLAESIEIQAGDKVIPGMVLAYIKQELFMTEGG